MPDAAQTGRSRAGRVGGGQRPAEDSACRKIFRKKSGKDIDTVSELCYNTDTDIVSECRRRGNCPRGRILRTQNQ